jgi:type II secretory pathway pseudopilin PulG
MNQITKNTAGATLLELLVGSSVLLVILFSISQQMMASRKFTKRQKDLDSTALIVQTLLDQIRARIQIYPKSFVPVSQPTLETIVNGYRSQDTWPLAWSDLFFGKKSQCPSCPGRASYYISQRQVIAADQTDQTGLYQGLYDVRVILWHPTLFGEQFAREYFFTAVSR